MPGNYRTDKQLGSYGDDSGSPTFGISISPWVIVLLAAVYLTPKILPALVGRKK